MTIKMLLGLATSAWHLGAHIEWDQPRFAAEAMRPPRRDCDLRLAFSRFNIQLVIRGRPSQAQPGEAELHLAFIS